MTSSAKTVVGFGASGLRREFSSGAPIRLGFVPLNDCAPLIVARELGIFDRYGLHVRLSRELGWATVRDKIAQGELDAAHAPCGLPLALAAGLQCVPTETVAGVILNLEGNAITLGQGLWDAGVRDAATLRQYILQNRNRRVLTFGTVSANSSHSHLLRTWMNSGGAAVDQEVRLVVVPPPQMQANLAAGHLDGFCAGEPWNSLTVKEGNGWIAATSRTIAPGHPEKVLVARSEFARQRNDEHVALIAALLEACDWCATPANHAALAELLAERRHVGVPAAVIRHGLSGPLPRGCGLPAVPGGVVTFAGPWVHEPGPDRAAWIATNLLDASLRPQFPPERLARIYQGDCHRHALTLSEQPHPEPTRETNLLPA